MPPPDAEEHRAPSELSARALPLLEQAQDRGFLGPGPVADQLARALAFLPEGPPANVRAALDLGTGGGLPGLVLALAWPRLSLVLLDSSQKRARWLREVCRELELGDRVHVVGDRAEDAARSDLRGAFDLVTARSFGPPPATAECGAPFLRTGGSLVIAEPPEWDPRRWPSSALELLGLELLSHESVTTSAGPASFVRLLAVGKCPDRYPRRTGVPFKRPLF